MSSALVLLDTIEAALAAGPLSSLSSGDQQAALIQLLAPYQPQPPSAADVQALQTFYTEVGADNADVLTEITDGSVPDEVDAPSGPPPDDLPEVPLLTFPAPPAPTPAQILAATTYAGPQLVSTPLVTAPPPPPPAEPPVSPVLIADLLAWALVNTIGAVLPQSLVDELTAAFGSDDPGEETPPTPPPTAPALSSALATWILNA